MTNNNNMMVVAQKVCFLYCRISIIFCKGPKKNPCPAVYLTYLIQPAAWWSGLPGILFFPGSHIYKKSYNYHVYILYICL